MKWAQIGPLLSLKLGWRRHQFHFTALVKILTRLRWMAGRSELCVIKTTPNTLWEMHSCQKRRPLPTCYFCVQFFNVCKIPVGSSLTILTLHQFGRISDQGHPHHQSVNVITRGKSLSILEWWVTIKFLSHHLSEILGETSKVCHL